MNIHGSPTAARREVLKAFCAASAGCVIASTFAGAFAQNLGRTRPDPRTFESGDFLWPKTPGKFVPYNSSLTQEYESAKQQWQSERSGFVQRVKNDAGSTATDKEAAAILEKMEFREFLARYLADEDPSVPGRYSSGSGLYVGHTAVLSIENDGTFVIEAVWGNVGRVRRIAYGDWLQERSDDLVWHGRLKNFDTRSRAGVADEAKKHIGIKYDFWNFDLNDDSAFYCSKLVWMSVFRRLSLAVDNNPQSKRALWFSPKQLLHCDSSLSVLFSPGNYGTV